MTDEEALEVCKLRDALILKRNAALKAFLLQWDSLPENVELKKAYQEKCAEYGHVFAQLSQPTVFGYTWKECRYCYERIDIEPPSEIDLKDIQPVGEYPIKLPKIAPKHVDHKQQQKGDA